MKVELKSDDFYINYTYIHPNMLKTQLSYAEAQHNLNQYIKYSKNKV